MRTLIEHRVVLTLACSSVVGTVGLSVWRFPGDDALLALIAIQRPTLNDLDAYALVYGIAALMTNLHVRGKEPFWQQGSTNLVKFVILLHQVPDDYVTLFQVYEHVINPQG